MSDHTLTYNPNPDGSAPITRCSCGWIAKSGDDVHLISPHAVGMIADQRDLLIAQAAQIAALEAEVERLVGCPGLNATHSMDHRLRCDECDPLLAPFVVLMKYARHWSDCEWTKPNCCACGFANALAHPAVQRVLENP